MRQVTQYRRPSIDIAWWYTIQPEEVKEHYRVAYEEPGYRIGETFTESEDGLLLTHDAEWSETALPFNDMIEIWLSDDVVNKWKDDRQNYCDAVGIIRYPTTIYWTNPGDGTESVMVTG
jgi:hypothetical protein